MKPISTLIAIANEHALRLLHTSSDINRLVELTRHDIADHPEDSPAPSDRQGRMRQGHGPISALDRSTSEGDLAMHRFAVRVVHDIDNGWKNGAYDRLIIAAPPKMLGAIREALSPVLRAALFADLHKDLLKIPSSELAGHFAEVTRI